MIKTGVKISRKLITLWTFYNPGEYMYHRREKSGYSSIIQKVSVQIYIEYKKLMLQYVVWELNCNVKMHLEQNHSLGSGGAEVAGALRTSKTPTNVVGYFMICLFFLNYGYNIGLIMGILLVKLELS